MKFFTDEDLKAGQVHIHYPGGQTQYVPLTALYADFTQRLIEKLCTETVQNEFGQHSFLRLIDSTEGKNRG